MNPNRNSGPGPVVSAAANNSGARNGYADLDLCQRFPFPFQLVTMILSILTLSLTLGTQPRQVDIPSFDGVMLHATYYAAGSAGPAVIIFRNCDRDRTSLDTFARRLTSMGIHTLTWDYRNGEAPGLDWRQTRLRDAEAVAKWLVQQPSVDQQRLVAIGGSCGVSLALDFAQQHSPAPRGLVLLSGPSDPEHLAFVARTPALAVFGGASQAEGAAVPYVGSVVRMSANPASRLVTPADGGHGTEMLTHTPEFQEAVLSWIDERLR